jgi:hypothetical protein
LWAAIKSAIATIKKIVARLSNIVLWPLNVLAKRVKRINVIVMRYAIRARNRTLFLSAMLWFPVISFGLLAWGLYTVPIKPDPAYGPVEAAIFWFVKNMGPLIIFVLKAAIPIRKALSMYRRLTRAKRVSAS